MLLLNPFAIYRKLPLIDSCIVKYRQIFCHFLFVEWKYFSDELFYIFLWKSMFGNAQTYRGYLCHYDHLFSLVSTIDVKVIRFIKKHTTYVGIVCKNGSFFEDL